MRGCSSTRAGCGKLQAAWREASGDPHRCCRALKLALALYLSLLLRRGENQWCRRRLFDEPDFLLATPDAPEVGREPRPICGFLARTPATDVMRAVRLAGCSAGAGSCGSASMTFAERQADSL